MNLYEYYTNAEDLNGFLEYHSVPERIFNAYKDKSKLKRFKKTFAGSAEWAGY